jgi:hypothetical protein
MKSLVLAALALVIAGVMIAGCTQSPATVTPSATTVPAASAPAATTTVGQSSSASFTLGDHYLQKSYSFQSETDTKSEQFRVDNASWGIDIQVLPLNDDLQYCWFEMTVTNRDNGKKDTYGFGRTYPTELHQQIPMYVKGPYQIDMKGNRVKVDLTAAKRNP